MLITKELHKLVVISPRYWLLRNVNLSLVEKFFGQTAGRGVEWSRVGIENT